MSTTPQPSNTQPSLPQEPDRSQTAQEEATRRYKAELETIAEDESLSLEEKVSRFKQLAREFHEAYPNKRKILPRPGRRETFAEALEATNKQYGRALAWLAGTDADEPSGQSPVQP
jgi:hypothetical protein